ncbi:unnamed protein product [Camellia sinensis]
MRLMALDNNYVQPVIPRFDGHYDHWSMLMENFLRSKEYWPLVETSIPEPASGAVMTDTQKTELAAQKLKDLKAKNYLLQAIDHAILETILEKDTSKQIWDSLKKKYQGTTKVKRAQLQALRKEFEILHTKKEESVSDYFSRTMVIASKMRIHGDKMEDVTVVEKILRSMTTKFDYVFCSIEESNKIDELLIDELRSSLLVHEQRVNRTTSEEQALKISTNDEISTLKGSSQDQKIITPLVPDGKVKDAKISSQPTMNQNGTNQILNLLEFLQQLADTDGSSTIPPSVHRVLNSKACRGAIMFGDTLLPSECSLIVEELKQTSLCFQ